MSNNLNFNLNNEAELQRLLMMAQQNPEILKQEYEKLLSQNKPVTSKDYLDPNYKLQLDKEGGVVIEPEPSFVMKTRDIKSKEKIFINVVTHPIIDEPEEKDFVEYENETGLRLPMSLGPLKEDHSKQGEICKVADCIINPNVATNLKKDPQMLGFFYQLVNTYVNQKYKIQLEEAYTLPKLSYKGKSIEFQRVKGKKAPKIQTLSTEEKQQAEKQKKEEARAYNDVAAAKFIRAQAQTIEWELYLIKDNGDVEEFDGFNQDLDVVRSLKFEFYFPLLMTGKHIDLQLSEDEIVIRAGKIYSVILKPVILVDPMTAVSYFNTNDRKLYIEVEKLKKIFDEEDLDSREEEAEVSSKKNINVPDLSNEMLYDLV